MKTLIVDDEPSARKGIKRVLSNHPMIEIIGEVHNATSLKPSIKKFQPDLIFLDVMLRDTNSLDLIDTLEFTPLIIVTTAYDNHALKGFDLKAIDYLMKPISEHRLYAAIDRAFTLYSSKTNLAKTLLIKSEGRYIKLYRKDILFIKGLQNYVLIYTHNKKHICKTSMKVIESKLGSKEFLRIHKSFIVNTQNIDGFEKRIIYVREHELPIGKTMKDATYKVLMRG